MTLPGRVHFKMIKKERKAAGAGDIHYIGGTEVLPAPLKTEEENRFILLLSSDQSHRARTILIEHNLPASEFL